VRLDSTSVSVYHDDVADNSLLPHGGSKNHRPDPQRWNEVVRSSQATQQALASRAASWRQQAQETLTSVESGLRERLRTVGVPDEALDEEIAGMSPIYTSIRERLSAAELSFTDARGALTALSVADAELRRRVADLREKYRPVVVVERRELRLRWADLVSSTSRL